MSNTTQKRTTIHGKNPQFLIEKVIRSRIWDSNYWKEHCFALNAVSIIDRAASLKYVGGTFGGHNQPSEFICLVLKLLQLGPEREIILEYLRAEDFKYLRALAAFYIRLTFDPVDVFETLEPMLEDYRKLRYRNLDGSYRLTTMDDFVDELLTEERVCEVQLPRLTLRKVLEETEGLPKRRSKLSRAMGLEEDALSDDVGYASSDEERERYMSRSPSRSPSPGSDPSRGRYTSRSPSRSHSDNGSASPQGDKYISRSPSPAGYISRSPTRSPEP